MVESIKSYEVVIGLEVHAQLSTESKIFATSSATSGKQPNSLTDPVTLGLPGALPVLNKRAVDFAIRLGLATNCEIREKSIFARKHYFYPDLPKGYQISQYDLPICEQGKVDVRTKSGIKSVGLTRIHMEEDAGKNIHLESEPSSVVDLNRAGVALLEIVTEPDIRSSEEAGAFLRHLRQIVRYLDICDGNMEEGSLRCDANVSVREVGTTAFGTKVEIKNLNSFKHVEKAIEYEIARQSALEEQGKGVIQETRLWDENKGVTKSMRSKEQAEDYRYFPDPDLLPLIVDKDWIERVREALPELPEQAFKRYQKMYGLDDYFCEILTEEKHVSMYYDQAVSTHNNPSAVANWVTTELFGRLNKEGIKFSNCPVSPENLGLLVKLIDDDVISGKIAKSVFDEMFQTGAAPESIIEAKGLKQITDVSMLALIVDNLLSTHPEQVKAYREGKTKMLGFFVGEIMKATQGKANPKAINQLLAEKLGPVSE
jgi:aspartyl-tRNA(Asn)/glutamyl-tRNA(Gln) amidotransferase subunit B